jgi:hypothetical protein
MQTKAAPDDFSEQPVTLHTTPPGLGAVRWLLPIPASEPPATRPGGA